MKIIDFENLFESKLKIYLEENKGKYTQEQWESLIPKLYKSFGDTFIKAAGATPKEYFAKMTDGELSQYLKGCEEEKVPVTDFFTREMERRDFPEEFFSLAREKRESEEILKVLIEGAGDGERAGEFLFEVLTGEYPEEIKALALERLREFPISPFLERSIALFQEGKGSGYLLELLVGSNLFDERIFAILKGEIERAGEELEVLCPLAARYGDERLLEVLYRRIESEEIGYVAYRELRLAIEALGGEVSETERDFSADKDFLPIKEESEKHSK